MAGTDDVTVSYTGWLVEQERLGAQFDSSDSFLVRLSAPSVIRGWLDTLPGCSESGVYFVAIPAALGYGDKGIAGRIPANSDLMFKISVKQITQVLPANTAPSPTTTNDLTDSSSVESFPAARKHNLNEKNEILSRMARMGAQQALPTPNNPVPSSPEPDEESRSRASSVKSNRSKRKARSSTTNSMAVEERPPQIPVKPGWRNKL